MIRAMIACLASARHLPRAAGWAAEGLSGAGGGLDFDQPMLVTKLEPNRFAQVVVLAMTVVTGCSSWPKPASVQLADVGGTSISELTIDEIGAIPRGISLDAVR